MSVEEVSFSGAVLAGGFSKRFGSDKARYVLDGRALLTRVLDSLVGAAERFVVANRDYGEFGVPVYADVLPTRSPLSGVHTALCQAKEDWVAVAACDLPYLTPEYWAVLARHRNRKDVQAVVVEREGRLEPLAALYHRDLADEAARRLQRGDLAVHRFVGEINAHVLDWATLDLPPDTLTNLNTRPDALKNL